MEREDAGVFRAEFPDRPSELGALLRRLREERDIELDRIVQETKVSLRVFEALESGSYERLPEKVFCRNFLRQYAAILGGPEDAILDAFDRAWERFQMSSGSYPVFVPDEKPRRVFRWWLWAPALLGIVVIGSLATMMVRSCRGGKELQRDPRRSMAAVIPSPTVGTPPTPEPERSLPTPVPEIREGQETPFSVAVLPGRECWIRYRDHSGAMGQDLLRKGGRREFELPGPVLLTLGNADAAVISVGGREFDHLGSPGQVIHLEIGLDGLRKLGPMEVQGG